ncbi:efflux RND transporter permease subunit [Marinigracilibium pacificum]
MAYKAKNLEISYDFAKIVPPSDSLMIDYMAFKKQFGEDANLLVLGMKDSSVYELENFQNLYYLTEELSSLTGIKSVLSLSSMQLLQKNTAERKFDPTPLFKGVPESEAELDSLLEIALGQTFYTGQIINPDNGSTVLILALEPEFVNSEKRFGLVNDIQIAGEKFSRVSGVELHYAGIPFIRSIMSKKVQKELNMFLILSGVVTAIILFFFFRSFSAVFFPMIVIGVMVVWVMGTIVLMGYKMTLLTGLLPPIIVVIGVPNCIYLLNRYHQEVANHGNQVLALSRMIRKIGIVALVTNFTTAVGFIVLAFNDITILKEFGVVAGINIMMTYVVSIILIPSVFSFLPAPKARHLKHLEFKLVGKTINGLDLLVHRHRYAIFVVTGILLVIFMYGMTKVKSVSYMVDDIPDDSKIKKDLAFFENNFSGVMPLEVFIDTKKEQGIRSLSVLRRVEQFEDTLASLPALSSPISMVGFVKAVREAYYNNSPAQYKLPTGREQAFIYSYLRNGESDNPLVKSFIDSTGQKMRVSLKMADIGSNKMDSLVENVIIPAKNKIFEGSDIDVSLTGTTLLFIKGNKYLIENLRQSLILAFIIISIIMAILFANVRMIIISLIPNFIPLIITAGIMGYAGIPLKPSTALIFSIAFGISVDDSIHFLAKYRQALYSSNFFVPIAISKSLKEVGQSMIYTSIVLFFGFVIFAFSEFGGTVALGILTSLTLLVAMMTNLVVLPALLMVFDKGKREDDFHPLIEQYDEFYLADEDEEIEIEAIQVKKDQ